MKYVVSYFFIFFISKSLVAQPGTITGHLKIDQFGYPTYAEKICVINNPVIGFDEGDLYIPGATLQVRNATTNALVASGPAVEWHNGDVYDQSGDEIWWFDFSTVNAEGDYYIYDPANDKSSYTFSIRDDVYQDVLKQSVRMFFYQRSGFEKEETYAFDWDDGASHLGIQQDLDCRLVTDPVPATSKQLHGGWFDAGDYNKYVNFAYEPMHDLLTAYLEQPLIWTDDYNIPESGNGIPDLLDEVKWEMDWIRRMQNPDGSVLMKVSVTDWSASSPPSADTGYRRYGPAQGSATRVAASIFALGAIAYDQTGHPLLQAYADTLEAAAILAWDWLEDNPAYSNYSNEGFVSANPEMNAYQQLSVQVGAAILLFARTGNTLYRDYVDEHYDEMQPLLWGYWYPWESIIQDLLLYYASLPGGTTSVKNSIVNSFLSSMNSQTHLLPAYVNKSCAYRGYLNNGDNVWGSNRPRGHNGSTFYNIITYDLVTDTVPYRNAALGYVNFLHGVNPISIVMLTNMYDYGAEKPANEMYHSWFAHGTDYDNAVTSLYGPAPGYQTGGFNPNYQPDPAYGGNIIPPQFQPSLKSYKDWNTSWPENSWEITETSISNQGSYVKLLSKFVPPACVLTVTSPSDDGQSSLRRAVQCASVGDTIFLDLPNDDTIALGTPLVFNKNLTIINLNPGHAPIQFDHTGTGWQIDTGVNVHLHDLYITGASSPFLLNSGNLFYHDVILDASGNPLIPVINNGSSNIDGTVEIRD